MRYVSAVTLALVAGVLGAWSLTWMLATSSAPLVADSPDLYGFGYNVGSVIAKLFPAALAGLALHGALRQLRRHR